MRTPIFRWKAIQPLALVIVVFCVLWTLFGDAVVRRGLERAGSALLGTEVDIARLRIRTFKASVELGGFEIASPFDSMKNLVDAGTIVVDLDPSPLFEKKLVIDRLQMTGMRFATTRRTPARRPPSNGTTPAQLLASVESWASGKTAPLLALTPIDTVRQLVLDPGSLATVKAADALARSADSIKTEFTHRVNGLALQPLADSTQALVKELAAFKPSLGTLSAASSEVQRAKQGLARIDSAKRQVTALEQSARGATAALESGVRAVDSARQKDYDFARGLLKLPKLDAPNIAAAFFGPEAMGNFREVLYWARLMHTYAPPGLDPFRRDGPKRLRRAGMTYFFPLQHVDPNFLLRAGELSFSLGGDTATSSFSGQIRGLTTQPAVYGAPTTFSAKGATTGVHALSGQLGLVLDHVSKPVRDSGRAHLEGIELPVFTVPGLPFRVDPNRAAASLEVAIRGDDIHGMLSLRTTSAKWSRDDASATRASLMENAAWEVLSGLTALDVTAEISGALSSPALSVRSSLDEALAARLRAVAGEQFAKAEAQARAAVDKAVAAKVDPVLKDANGVSSSIAQQLGLSKTQLDQLEQALNAQLLRLGPGGVLKLP